VKDSLEERRREFADFVWNHAADAFQAKFDQCAALTASEIAVLGPLLRQVAALPPAQSAPIVLEAVKQSPALLRKLLQLTGLTRNKIVQDIKGVVRQDRLKVSTSSAVSLFNTVLGAKLASEYLAHQIHRVFAAGHESIDAEVLEAVNQATWPGYIRQERAKRMGHEAEFRLACLMKDCRLGFAPAEKAENPMCRDTSIDGMSYDLVSPSADRALMRVIATVHTANIGQYGESKDELEIRKAIAAMERAGDRQAVVLLAFIDGVGFESNRAGLNGVLRQADEFCQFRTIWKAAVIAAHKQEQKIRVALPRTQITRFTPFLRRYGASSIDASNVIDLATAWIAAGDAYVQLRGKEAGRSGGR